MRNKYKISSSSVLDRSDLPTSPGDEFHIEYESSYAKDGSIVLREGYKTDIQKEINSHREECDMSLIVSRYLAGDVDIINQRSGFYGDFTNLPKSNVEWLQLIDRSRDAFNLLPLDVRQKFDMDPNKWIATAGSPEWMDTMKLFTPSAESVSAETTVEVKENVKTEKDS